MTGNTSAVRRLKKYELTPKNACGGCLRTADVVPVVASLFFGGTEATTGNTSAVCRLVFLRRGKKSSSPRNACGGGYVFTVVDLLLSGTLFLGAC